MHFDTEAEYQKDYIKQLMHFRKDELVLPDSSDEENDKDIDLKKPKKIRGIEDAYEIVDTLETQLRNISQCVDGIDKRMGHNLRMIGKTIVPQHYVPYE